MIWRGRWRILAGMVQPAATTEQTSQTSQTERRRRFVLLECPFCREAHDALVDGGRLKTPCGREAEAMTVDGVTLARVWGLEGERREMKAARLI